MSAFGTATEQEVAAAFSSMLETAADATTDFFEAGGDSVIAVNLAILLSEMFEIEVAAELIEDLSTVRQVAAWIDAERASRNRDER